MTVEKSKFKKIVATFLVVLLVIGMMPSMHSFAEEGVDPSTYSVTVNYLNKDGNVLKAANVQEGKSDNGYYSVNSNALFPTIEGYRNPVATFETSDPTTTVAAGEIIGGTTTTTGFSNYKINGKNVVINVVYETNPDWHTATRWYKTSIDKPYTDSNSSMNIVDGKKVPHSEGAYILMDPNSDNTVLSIRNDSVPSGQKFLGWALSEEAAEAGKVEVAESDLPYTMTENTDFYAVYAPLIETSTSQVVDHVAGTSTVSVTVKLTEHGGDYFEKLYFTEQNSMINTETYFEYRVRTGLYAAFPTVEYTYDVQNRITEATFTIVYPYSASEIAKTTNISYKVEDHTGSSDTPISVGYDIEYIKSQAPLSATFDPETQTFKAVYKPGDADVAKVYFQAWDTEGKHLGAMTLLDAELSENADGELIATVDVSDRSWDGLGKTQFVVQNEAGKFVYGNYVSVYNITMYADNYGTVNNEILDTYYVTKNTQIMDVLPNSDKEFIAAGGELLEGQKLAVGLDASQNPVYPWYYKADNKFDEVLDSTIQAALSDAEKAVYPVKLSEITFLDEDGKTELTTLWTDFLGSNNNLYSVSTHSIPDTEEMNSLGYEWKHNGGTDSYTDTEIPTLSFLDKPVTFVKGAPAEPYDGVEVVWSDIDTEKYLIEAIRAEAGLEATDKITISSPASFNVIWADEPSVNGSYNSDDIASQAITFKVNDGEEQTINARIYPRYVLVNRINTHVAVQGSNVMVDYEDEKTYETDEGKIQYPHGYYMQFVPDEVNGIQLTGSFYESFYKRDGVNAYSDQPIIELTDWTPLTLENIPNTASHEDLDVVYKGEGNVYQLAAGEQKQHQTEVDVSKYSNYYFYKNQGSLTVYAANDFETSKIYDSQPVTITADQLINEPEVRGEIDEVSKTLPEGQQLVIRFSSDYVTEGVNFNQTSYTTTSANVGTYEVPFKVLVADEEGNVIAEEKDAQFSEENAYTATINITERPIIISGLDLATSTPGAGDYDVEGLGTDRGLLAGHRVTNVNLPVTGLTYLPENATIIDADGNDVTANYNISYEPGTLVAATEDPTPPPVTPILVVPGAPTPLAAGLTDTVTVDDQEVPLAAGGASWSLLDLILTIATGLMSGMLLITYFARKREDEDEYAEYGEVKRKGMLRLMSIIPMVGAIILFILTQDMTLPMIIVDEWTIYFAAIAIVQGVVTYFSKKKVEEDEDDLDAMA